MGMQDDRPNNTPPRSMADPDEYPSKAGSINNGTRTPQQLFSPAPRSRISDILLDPPLSRNGLKAPSHIEEVDERDDVNSNVQDGTRSELGEMPVVSSYASSFIGVLTPPPSASLVPTILPARSTRPTTPVLPLATLAHCPRMSILPRR